MSTRPREVNTNRTQWSLPADLFLLAGWSKKRKNRDGFFSLACYIYGGRICARDKIKPVQQTEGWNVKKEKR